MKKYQIVLLSLFAILTIGVLVNFMVKDRDRSALDEFNKLNRKLEESNRTAAHRLDSLKQTISNVQRLEKLKVLDSLSTDFITYIERLKEKMLMDVKDPTDYERMDSDSTANKLFFSGEDHSPTGREFVKRVANFEENIITLFAKDSLIVKEQLDEVFNKREDIDDWLDYNYKGFPLIATITRLTVIISDIEDLNEDLINQALSK